MRGWAGSGSTTRGRQTRLLVLQQDGWQCQFRGPTGTAHSVDHIVALKDGGAKYEPSNLRAACTRCNSGRRDDAQIRVTTVEIRTQW